MKRLPLHLKILIGLVLGAISGAIVQSQFNGTEQDPIKKFTSEFIRVVGDPVGSLFLNMIFMIVVPLLFAALVLGVSEIGDAKKVGRIGVRSLLLTIVLSSIAVVVGLAAVNFFKPGTGISVEQREELYAKYAATGDAEKRVKQAQEAEQKNPVDYLNEIVPRNPLNSAVTALEGGLIGFMVFALIFGIALGGVEPERALPVREFLEGLFAVCLKVLDMAMKLAPYGVFALMFKATALLGIDAIRALMAYALVVLGALAFHQFVIYSIAIKLLAKRNPLEFFGQIKGVMFTAFATSSSNATLPHALKSAEEDLGLPRDISSFVLTVGATANQNGTALFEGITILFLAQLFGIPLDLGQQVTVMALSILAGVGTAGVPGGSWPMIAIICGLVGIPPTAIGLCIGVDRILDMSRTVLNVSGDITIAACVSSMEGRGMEIPESV